jgi:hypothetical protein
MVQHTEHGVVCLSTVQSSRLKPDSLTPATPPVSVAAVSDFVRPAIWCKQQGCVSLELIYYDPIASREIRELEANWKMEWRDLLDCMMGR